MRTLFTLLLLCGLLATARTSSATVHFRVLNYNVEPGPSNFYSLAFDLSQDGNPDLELNVGRFGGTDSNYGHVTIPSSRPDNAVLHVTATREVVGLTPLQDNMLPAYSWGGPTLFPYYLGRGNGSGQFVNVQRYMEVRYTSSGQTFYGWIKLYFTPGDAVIHLVSCAYSDVPNERIRPADGDPTSVAMLTQNSLSCRTAGGLLHISGGTAGQELQVIVTDLGGRTVASERLTGEGSLSAPFASGAYVVRILDLRSQSPLFTRKLMLN